MCATKKPSGTSGGHGEPARHNRSDTQPREPARKTSRGPVPTLSARPATTGVQPDQEEADADPAAACTRKITLADNPMALNPKNYAFVPQCWTNKIPAAGAKSGQSTSIGAILHGGR